MTETEKRGLKVARAALRAAGEKLSAAERARRVRAGEARRKKIESAGGTYRATLRRADGSDVPERRARPWLPGAQDNYGGVRRRRPRADGGLLADLEAGAGQLRARVRRPAGGRRGGLAAGAG